MRLHWLLTFCPNVIACCAVAVLEPLGEHGDALRELRVKFSRSFTLSRCFVSPFSSSIADGVGDAWSDASELCGAFTREEVSERPFGCADNLKLLQGIRSIDGAASLREETNVGDLIESGN
jgi:hypothetical protein